MESTEKENEIIRNRYSYENNKVYPSNRGFNILNHEDNNLNPVKFDKGWDNVLKRSNDGGDRKVYVDPYDFTDQREMKRNFMATERNGIDVLTL
jgi:hypothetical protein